jgi:hypothetical protein
VEKLPPASELQALAETLCSAGASEAAFQYVLRMKQMNLTGAGGNVSTASASGNTWGMPGIDGSLMSGIAGQFSKQLTKLMGGTRQVCALVVHK